MQFSHDSSGVQIWCQGSGALSQSAASVYRLGFVAVGLSLQTCPDGFFRLSAVLPKQWMWNAFFQGCYYFNLRKNSGWLRLCQPAYPCYREVTCRYGRQLLHRQIEWRIYSEKEILQRQRICTYYQLREANIIISFLHTMP